MLHVHRAERADALVPPLAGVLADPPEDPLAPDVVAVPTRGVERWLAQRLSHHLGAGPADEAGVCANVAFPPPADLVATVLGAFAAGAGADETAATDGDDDPWDPARLTWPLLDVIDDCAGEPWCVALGHHLGVVGADVNDDDTAAGEAADLAEVRRGRRLAVADRLARRFTRYGTERPEMLRAWAAGTDGDGAGAPVPEDLAWQPELWRRLRTRVGRPSPAERLDAAIAALTADPRSVDLPGRLSVFGPTRLPTDQLEVLRALAGAREVHLWLPHPSPALWEQVAGRAPASTPTRRADVAVPGGHPLLRSMARDATELEVRLLTGDGVEDTHHPAPPPPGTLLGALQQRLRDNDPGRGPAARHRLAEDDRSVAVHACHGRWRQVEVLREVLVGLFEDDPTLEPRDVLVMCPDVEAFAPLVTATFGVPADREADTHPGQRLRVRLADRSLRETNPVLELLSSLLELADGRVTASDVLDLAGSDPVRRRFRLGEDDLARLREWTVSAGVHWGEDLARRERFGLAALRQGTWDTGLDRLLLGVAMAEEGERYVGTALPLDDVDSTDVDLAGRFAELVERLSDVLRHLNGSQPVSAWADHLERALGLLAEPPASQPWQEGQARGVLADVRTGSAGHAGTPLRLGDVRALLADRLRGRPTRAGFRTGALTVCSLEPMRAVPHRVVCLLGLDDGAFPRARSRDGDDALLRAPLVGERDARSEDRELFLDAVTAATDHLVVVHTGADERTGALRPPAVPVGELLDALDLAADTTGGPVRDRVLVRHPLQDLDERNFAAGGLGRPGPFSFDAVAHRAAEAARTGARPVAPFLDGPLPAGDPEPEVDLDDLVASLEHPVRWFLRTCLGISLAGEVEGVEDRIPLELAGLDGWHVGDRLLRARLAGVPENRAVAAEWRRGLVPPKALGGTALRHVSERVEPIARAAERLHTGAARLADVTVTLPSGTLLTGSVPGVHGDVVVRTTYSRLGGKHRLRAWVQLLALAAAGPDRAWRAATVGRAPGSRPRAAVSAMTAPDPATAGRVLGELLRVREAARREPLPLPVETARAYASSRHAGDEVVQALVATRREWDGGFERSEPHHVLCWGEDAELDAFAGRPTAEDSRAWPAEDTRLGALARTVWEPVLAHEQAGTT